MPGSAQKPDDAIVAAGLSIRRGSSTVLKNLDCSIRPGAITGLLGPSGSGKTTLMRAMVGLQRISAGSICVLGKPASDAELRSRIGYVSQAPSVYPDITVQDNVRYFGALHSMPRRRADEAIDAVGLRPFAKRKTANLSDGQFSRVSLACALVSGPEVLILDEPTVGLDPVLRVQPWEQFSAMATTGTTLIISSHMMEEASHCDSLLLLREGHLLAQLSPAELRQRSGTDDLEVAFLRLIRSTGAEHAP